MNKKIMKIISIITLALSFMMSVTAQEQLGSVKTTWKGDAIEVFRFDDPDVSGVSIYFSKPNKAWSLEDPSRFSIAVRQTGPITIPAQLPKQKELASVKASALFKAFHVVRIHDVKKGVLVYLIYSKKFIDGSPQSSISAVVIPPEQEHE